MRLLSVTLTMLLVSAPALAKDEAKVVAIANLLPDPALLEVIESFKTEMGVLGYTEGKNVEYVVRDANGQVQLAGSIARELVSRNPDVILPMTEPMIFAVTKVAKSPIVFAVLALPKDSELLAKLGKDPNITGVMEQWPAEKQLELMKEITPGIKKVGMLFMAGAPPSLHWVSIFQGIAPKYGIELVQGPVNAPEEMAAQAQSLAKRTDALLLSIDGLVAQTVPAAVKAGIQTHKPVYAGAESFIQRGAVAGVSTSYRKIGIEAARRVDRILKGERGLPIIYPEDSEIYVNAGSAGRMGVTIPPAVVKRATKAF